MKFELWKNCFVNYPPQFRLSSVAVLIASLYSRREFLKSKSLKSVYEQKNIARQNVFIVLVSDDFERVREMQNVCDELRRSYNFQNDEMQTLVLANSRTKGHSGTGAWNTGIEYNCEILKCAYLALLDDDDCWSENYLFEHLNYAKQNNFLDAGIFSYIEWKSRDPERNAQIEIINKSLKFSKSDLSPKNFFIGNPGIQGSNIFVKSDVVKAISGFDENLTSCTDRDFMIRFLRYAEKKTLQIGVNPKVLSFYSAFQSDSVTFNKAKKFAALDYFYKKYAGDFSSKDFEKSLARAQKLFGYEGMNK